MHTNKTRTHIFSFIISYLFFTYFFFLQKTRSIPKSNYENVVYVYMEIFRSGGGGDYFFSNLKFINLLKIGKKKTTKNLHIKKRKVRCLFFTNKILPGGGGQ